MSEKNIFIISGRSMEPFLRKKRDIAIANIIELDSIMFGDIIAFYTENNSLVEEKTNIICHRVIWKNNKKNVFYEKGDAYLEYSEITAERIVGRVDLILRDGHLFNLRSIKWKLINYFLASMSILSLVINFAISGFCKRRDKHTKGILYYLEIAIFMLNKK